ncbi:MAG: phenylacetate--CoA ligase family protein [Chloroflexi bacterium]|nr:phenylacetate--CoA ligase family protein [Chloroflexota bacterium]
MAAAIRSEVETMSREEVRALQDRLLAEQVEYVFAQSPFYRRKFELERLTPDDLRTVMTLERLSFTTKAEIRASQERRRPLGDFLAVDPSRVMRVVTTSGTTGKPVYYAYDEQDLRAWFEVWARGLWAQGWDTERREIFLSVAGVSRLYGGSLADDIASYLGALPLPVGGEAGAERALTVLDDFGATVLWGTPSYLAYLGRRCPDVLGKPGRDTQVRLLSVSGEPGGGIPQMRAELEELWGADVRESLGMLGFVQMWSECSRQDGMHYIAPDYCVAQLLDLESGEVSEVTEGAQGELVYSLLQWAAHPQLRYRTGDVAVVTAGWGRCECGRTGPKVRCIGRTDDMLIVRGVNLYPSAVKEVASRFRPATTGAIRIVLDSPAYSFNHPLKLKVEYGSDGDPQHLSDLRVKIEDALRQYLGVRSEVLLVPAGTLDEPATSGRLTTTRKVEWFERTYLSVPEQQ